jgi:hypothetical protein
MIEVHPLALLAVWEVVVGGYGMLVELMTTLGVCPLARSWGVL